MVASGGVTAYRKETLKARMIYFIGLFALYPDRLFSLMLLIIAATPVGDLALCGAISFAGVADG